MFSSKITPPFCIYCTYTVQYILYFIKANNYLGEIHTHVFHSHRFCQSLFNMIFSFFGQISGCGTVQYIARWKIIGHQCIWHSFLQEIVLQELSPQFRHLQSFVGKRGSIASYSVTRCSFIYLHSDISGFCPNSWLSQWQVEFCAVLKRKVSNSLISRTVPSLAQHFPRQCKVKLNAFPDSAKSSSTLSRTVQSLYLHCSEECVV